MSYSSKKCDFPQIKQIRGKELQRLFDGHEKILKNQIYSTRL